MNTKIISSFILTSAVAILAACCPSTTVITSWGTQVSVAKCIQQIKYSGNSFKIGEATIPIGQAKVIIKGVEWDTKKLQDAAAAIQAMEQTRLRLCEERVTDIQMLKYDDYVAKDKKRQETQEKLDQLAYLVALNNPQAVEKWIEKYMTTVTVVTKDSKSLPTLGPSEIHLKMVPKDVGVQDVSTFLK